VRWTRPDSWGLPSDAYPSIIINSIDLTRLLRLIGDGRMGELIDWLAAEIDRLARAGAGSPVPLLSIVEAAADAAAERGLHDVAVLGTRFTMQGTFYPEVFARRGIGVRAPGEEDVAYVHEKYVTELIPGNYLPETRAGVRRVIERLVFAGADGVLLAGTELPLLLRDAEPADVPLLDTNRIHIQRALAELLA
jgi:aspartate racemase